MASKKQIEANRSNAKKSTGPQTGEGKAKSSMNALKHGLTSQRVWLNEEEERDFKEFRLGLVDEMEPWGSLEMQFVCRIAAQMWRLARVPGMEAELLEKMSHDSFDDSYIGLGEAFHKDIATYGGSLERLARYEAIIERSLTRLLNEYRKIQADRRRREKQHNEDCTRAGLWPYDSGSRDSDGDYGPPRPEALDSLHQNEAIAAEEAAEDTTTARPSRAASPRKRGERQEGRGGRGGNGIDKTTTRGRARSRQGAPPHPPSV